MNAHSNDPTDRQIGDEGASLLIVLVVVAVLGVLLASLTSFGATAEIITTSLDKQAQTTYTAGSGLDAAIEAASNDKTWGASLAGGACNPLNIPAANGVNGLAVNVTCNGQVRHTTPGSGTGDNNTPRYVVMTEPLSGDNGFQQASNNDLRVNGSMYLGGDVRIPVSGASLTSTGNVKAHGICDPGVIVTPPATEVCNASTIPYPTDPLSDGSDPTYQSTWSAALNEMSAAVDPTATATSVPTTCPASGVRILFPGHYTDAASLSALTGGGCNNGVVYFSPGTYLFDFKNNGDVWTLNNGSTAVIGGVVTGWDPATDAPSAYDAKTDTCAGNDAAPVAGQGVAFVFNGDSRMSVTQDASLRLCAQPSSTHQEIVVWGVNRDTGSPPIPTSDDKYYASVATSTTFSSPSNATGAPDGGTADAVLNTTKTTSASASLHAAGYVTTAIPSNANIIAVRARVKHSDVGSSDDLKSFGFSVSSGTKTDTTSVTLSSSLHEDSFPLTATDFDTPAKRAAAAVDIQLTEDKATGPPGSTRSVTEHVDSVQLSFDYTTPAVPGLVSENGCLIATDATQCNLIDTSGGAQAVYIHGTVYAPRAGLGLHLVNEESQTIDRGAVARTIVANITASSGFTGSLFDLPVTSSVTVTDPRELTFTAQIGGNAVATAFVQYDDSTTPATPKILSWNIKHCGPASC